MKVHVCIIIGFGINTDIEMAQAFSLVGAQTTRIHLNDLIKNPSQLSKFGIFVLPGGFSFGDHIGSGAMLAALIRRTLRDHLVKFIDRGGLVLGVCNGFQVLVRLGLVPGIIPWKQSVALVHNDSGRYEDRWVEVKFDSISPCLWTRNIGVLPLPVRHGEGKLVAPIDCMEEIEAAHLCVARYGKRGKNGIFNEITVPYPANPNGSLNNFAGLCDRTGQVLGLMPHPEAFLYRYHHPGWRNAEMKQQADLSDGALQLFRNAVNYAAVN